MQTPVGEDVVTQKARELCEAIVSQPNFRASHQRIEAFLADDQARGHYESVMTKGQALQEKKQRALPLNDEEIAAFEKDREALLQHPVARGFLEAQEELYQLQHSIQKQITMTLELGRVPGPEDLAGESCGHGCGCHDH
jgi:cell fate (sporulation/competence/biofilm development) regulator YlbF (YheA/YmcA/DUF963 family)